MTDMQTYIVERPQSWEHNAFSDLKGATALARTKAYREGVDYGIYKLAYTAVAPDNVENIVIKSAN